MQTKSFDTPVVFIIFNRPKPTRLVFDAIAATRQKKLFLIADGPRPNKDGEAEACEEVRKIVSAVDWPCEVVTNFSEKNLGCKERIISGLDWVFSIVEEAIILEDDCLPDPSFFPYCAELLGRYRGDARFSMIAGTNFVEGQLETEYSYFYSQMIHIWGWATWREAWQRYDRHLRNWPEIKRAGLLSEVFDSLRTVRYWTRVFDSMFDGTGPDTWDYQWVYTSLMNNSLSIVPCVNLVTNIGFGPDATHTVAADTAQSLQSGSLSFPLKHPPGIVPLRRMDRYDQKIAFSTPLTQRILSGICFVRDKVVGCARAVLGSRSLG